MKKLELARELAQESGVSPAEAADRLDRAVCQILTQLRKQGEARFPGVGRFRLQSGGLVTFEHEGGQRLD